MATKDLEVLTFAPVIIPTLCRYDHFKACLESLMMCTHADKTDVYIGLDYPAKEEHWDGYKKIKNYLNEILNFNKFKSLNVLIREKNYGIGPTGNASSLFKEVLEKYDRLIFSEDDNVFSPAFLDYINQGLEKFKDDKSLLAINGYRHFYDIKFENNSFYRQNVDFSAWGYGIWSDRIQKYNNDLNNHNYLVKKALNPINWIRVYRNGINRCIGFISLLRNSPQIITDNDLSVYMAINKMDVVMPKVSMVRNMGWDGSGMHCQSTNITIEKRHSEQKICTASDFEYVGSGWEFYKENHESYIKNSYARVSIIDLVQTHLKFFKRKYKNFTKKQ